MRDLFEQWVSLFIKVLGLIFGVLGAVSVFLPLADVTTSNIGVRIGILVGIVVIAAISSAFWTSWYIHRKSKRVYSSGKTSIYFEYEDISKIINMAEHGTECVTVVIPINTNLSIDFNSDVISKGTIHYIALEYLKKISKDIDSDFIKTVKIKKDGFSEEGRIGDWFMVTSNDLDINTNIQFLFVEFYNTEQKNGKWVNSEITKAEFLQGLQSMISAIPEVLEQESKVYIPLIGAGAGNVGKPMEVMHFMESMLRFNKGILRQEIHIIINEKYKADTPIYQLSEF